MLASFMLFVDFDAVSWEGVKFRGGACQRRDLEVESIRPCARKFEKCART
jgi:hypothetical protein